MIEKHKARPVRTLYKHLLSSHIVQRWLHKGSGKPWILRGMDHDCYQAEPAEVTTSSHCLEGLCHPTLRGHSSVVPVLLTRASCRTNMQELSRPESRLPTWSVARSPSGRGRIIPCLRPISLLASWLLAQLTQYFLDCALEHDAS